MGLQRTNLVEGHPTARAARAKVLVPLLALRRLLALRHAALLN